MEPLGGRPVPAAQLSRCSFLACCAACDPAPCSLLTLLLLCSEVFNPAILPRSPHLSFLTMGVVVEGAEEEASSGSSNGGSSSRAAAPATDPTASSLVFLYRLAEGRAAPSFGVHCAQLAGVPPPVLERARAVIAAQVGRDAA